LATGRTSLVTLWSYHPYQAFYAMVTERVQEQAQKRGYGLLVADVAAYDPSQTAPNTCGWPSDGILALDCGEYSQRVLHARPSADTPLVSMGTVIVPEMDAVQLDLSHAFCQAAEHLIDEGCRRIAYFSLVPENDSEVLAQCFRAPRKAYQEVMRAAGLDEEYIRLDTDTRAASRRTLVDYIRKHGCPDGILCRDDETATGASRALCDLGIRVGQDVLLTGSDGIQETQYTECPLTTIVLPVPRMCDLAWQFLVRRMANPSAPLQHVVLEAALVVRESSQRRTRRKSVKKPKPKSSARKGFADTLIHRQKNARMRTS
jgi:LacI family transcriptional regulator